MARPGNREFYHFHPMHPKNLILLLVASLLPWPDSLCATDGQKLFSTNCASCHGADGKAQTPAGKILGAKDLGTSKLPDSEIEKQIVNGGVKDANGKSRMPAFKDRLKAEEITALVVHVKSFRH